MTTFDFMGQSIWIVDKEGHKVALSPQEALDLLQWLSDKRGGVAERFASRCEAGSRA